MSYVSFFFSSRRRHTRYWRDWSSDVCSSDLRGQRHVEGDPRVVVDVDAVDQPEDDDVDPELGVDDVLHRLGHVLHGQRRGCLGVGRDRRQVAVAVVDLVGHDWLLPATTCAVASFHAIHPSSAHLTRAGNFATPANATPSSSTSSSGSTPPRPCMSSRNASCTSNASATRLPTTRSLRTLTDAWLIEQPRASYDTSWTTASSPSPSTRTRRVTSSPHVGFTDRKSVV